MFPNLETALPPLSLTLCRRICWQHVCSISILIVETAYTEEDGEMSEIPFIWLTMRSRHGPLLIHDWRCKFLLEQYHRFTTNVTALSSWVVVDPRASLLEARGLRAVPGMRST